VIEPPVRVPNESALPPDRARLIREALATHRAKRRALDDLDGEDRSLLEAVAFGYLFFPSARPSSPPVKDHAPGGGPKPGASDRR